MTVFLKKNNDPYDYLFNATTQELPFSLNERIELCSVKNIEYCSNFRIFDFPFSLEINTFIQRGCIKLLKSDRKDICNIIKDVGFK